MNRLLSFDVNGLNGYINTSVDFDRSLTILYGLNGSGKTSVLRLVADLANGNIERILSTEFRYAELVGEKRNSNKVRIVATNADSRFSLFVFDSEKKYCYEYERSGKRMKGAASSVDDDFEQSEAGRHLKSYRAPVFLNIDRTFDGSPAFASEDYIEDRYLRELHRAQRRHRFESKLETMERIKKDRGLRVALELIEEELFAISRKESQLNERFRNSVLTESLKTTSIESFRGDVSLRHTDIDELELQKESVVKMLKKQDQEDLLIHAEKLFEGAKSLLERANQLDSHARHDDADALLLLEIMINKSKLDYLKTISDIAQDYSRRLDESHRKIDHFLTLTNRFFNMIGKEIILSDRTIQINGRGGKTKIECLSSGERQIIILMSHLIFNKRLSKGAVFMLDEPELSLHIAWQEILLKTIMEASPSLQIVVATHAPSIIEDMVENCVSING